MCSDSSDPTSISSSLIRNTSLTHARRLSHNRLDRPRSHGFRPEAARPDRMSDCSPDDRRDQFLAWLHRTPQVPVAEGIPRAFRG